MTDYHLAGLTPSIFREYPGNRDMTFDNRV